MTSVITWYDVLGVLPDATLDDIREAWQAREAALQPRTLAEAPAEVLSAADRARKAVQEAGRVLADPAVRQSYDQRIGFLRPGEGLPPSSWGPPDPDVGLGEGSPQRARKPPSRIRAGPTEWWCLMSGDCSTARAWTSSAGSACTWTGSC